MRFLSILLVCVVLIGCATPYQDATSPFNITGGYLEEKGPGNLKKIYFSGNGYTSSALASKYALRRAAEVGKQNGMAYFATYQTVSDAASGKKSTTASVESAFSKPNAYFYVEYHHKKEAGDFSVNEILNNSKIIK